MKWFDVIACGLLIGMLCVGAWERNNIFRNELGFAEDVANKSPDKVRALSNYGASLILDNKPAEAIFVLTKATKIAEKESHASTYRRYFYAPFNLSVAYEHIGDLQNAYKYAHQAAEMNKNAETLTQLGKILQKIGWKPEEKK